MTWGHLLFSAGFTGYILLGIFLEERDLVALFGEQYRRYRKQVGMLIPRPGRNLAERAGGFRNPASSADFKSCDARRECPLLSAAPEEE
jgi:hypothetical protein